jgi:hypothetical protein
MTWPLVSDFSRMLQNPRIAFRDPELQQCAIEKNALGQPKPRSGNFATVYRGLRHDGSSLALRVFNRRADQRRQRYEAVSDYLAGRAIASFVSFVYDEQGIRSGADGKLYPLLRMDWAPGVTLFDWARDACHQQRTADLARGAETWAELTRDLAAHHLAHGDLQPGNVLVDETGRFTLVDYDCLAVPALMGQTNLEVGLAAYQHPGRAAGTTLFPGLDNFSALVIYVALRALAAEPLLWDTFVDAPGYDGLLFRSEDFASPRTSALRTRLLESADEPVRDLAHYLFELLRFDLHDVPCIDEVLLWCQSLDEVLARRDWDLAVKLVECMGAAETIGADLVPLVGEAYAHVAGWRALERALTSGDEVEIARCYRAKLLEGDPQAAPLLFSARQTHAAQTALAQLEADRQSHDWASLCAHWQEHAAILADRPSAESFHQEYELLSQVEQLRHALDQQPAADAAQVQAIWDRLQALGGHAAAQPLEARAQELIAEHRELAELNKCAAEVERDITFAGDTQLVAAWRNYLKPGRLRDPALREQVDMARARVRRLKSLNELAGVVTLEGEQAFVERAAQLPQDYHPKLGPRLRSATERLTAWNPFLATLQGPATEAAIAAAAADCERVGADRFLSDDQRLRAQLAGRRAILLGKLAAAGSLPDDARDRQILELWDHELLADCREAQPWRLLYQAAQRRAAPADSHSSEEKERA